MTFITDAALDTAKLIASKSPIAVIGIKHLLLHSRDHRSASPSSSLLYVQRHAY